VYYIQVFRNKYMSCEMLLLASVQLVIVHCCIAERKIFIT